MTSMLPLTSQPVHIAPGTTLVSKADLQGHITYANAAFVATSGYPLGTLIGSPHRIVRHPDMPPALFAGMWEALHQGKPWQGILKNRCQNGDFYWANACIVPIRRQEQLVGYMAVLTHVDPAAIQQAEQALQQAAHGMPPPPPLPGFAGRACRNPCRQCAGGSLDSGRWSFRDWRAPALGCGPHTPLP